MKKHSRTIPRLPLWFLKNSIPNYDYAYLESTFQELFSVILSEKGRLSANIWLWKEVIKSLPGFLSAMLYWRFFMFNNYMKVALRNFRRHKMYASLNIIGLAVGLACCILVVLYIDFELSFDRFFEKGDRIYRPVTEDFAGSPYLMGERLQEEIPEIEGVVRFRSVSAFEVPAFSHKDKIFRERGFYTVDPAVFEIFDFPFIYGHPENALFSPDSVVLTESTADKYFGHIDPTGKTLLYEDKVELTVTGVIKDIPNNSHFSFDILAAPSAIRNLSGRDDRFNWSSGNYRTYLLLNKEAIPGIVEKKMNAVLLKTENTDYFEDHTYFLQPLKKIHLHSHLRGEFEENGHIGYIYLYSTIGFIILIMACINFINLATAHSLNRSKEVGIRKVLGADRRQVIKQFLGESVLFAWLALPLALVLLRSFLPVFNSLTGSHVSQIGLNNLFLIVIIFTLTTVVGFLSGAYPAFFSSAFDPSRAFKSKEANAAKKMTLRNVLILVQFTVSAVFLCCTLIVFGQMNFIKKMDFGFETNRIINIPISKNVSEKALLIKEEFLKHPEVERVTISNFLPSHTQTIHQGGEWPGQTEGDIDMFRYIYVDYDFIDTFSIQLLKGRNFSKQIQSDLGGAYIMNEAAVQAIGWTEPIGKTFKIHGAVDYFGSVVGVVKDFHFRTLHHTIDPMVLYIPPDHPTWLFFSSTNFSVKTTGNSLPGVIRYLEENFKKYTPLQPFEFYFFDEDFDRAYRAEQKRGQLFRFFAVLSILIACLGLYGLAAFSTQRRIKEIGIRKVLGASVFQIVFLLTRESTKWILIANLLAWPIAYSIMRTWLQAFAYRINIHIGFFLMATLLTLLIAWITSSYLSIRASLADPVDSLRYE